MQTAAPEDLEGLIFDEDSDDNINLAKLSGAQAAADDAAGASGTQTADGKIDEPKLLKRNKRQRPRYTETDLLGRMGLDWVQRNFPRMLVGSVKCKRGTEAKDLQRILDTYTIWARKIHPNMHSDDVLDRSLVLSSRLSVKNTMDMMREAEETVAQDGLFEELAGNTAQPSTPTRSDNVAAHPSTAGDVTTPPLAASQLAAASPSASSKPQTVGSTQAAAPADDADIQAAIVAEQAAATQLDDFADFADEEAIAAEMDMGDWGDEF